jgi:hypothetical protein
MLRYDAVIFFTANKTPDLEARHVHRRLKVVSGTVGNNR